jgi:GNAT superfamily N-acetyltransferase
MKIQCFGCPTQIEAEHADALADVFLAHARQSHTWPYPDDSIQAYARNYGEATERLSGDIERRAEIGELSVFHVSEERVADWLAFFDHDAFAGNPGWASCYCLEPHAPAAPAQPERPWRTTRANMTERLCSGATFGYLAYAGGRAAGWVNASKRSEYGLYQLVDPTGPDPASVIGVSCFAIAPPFRRHGVASALLDRVIADAPSRAALWIEGYPHNTPEATDAGHFRGTRSMYAARGFEPIEERKRDTVMRLRVR